MRRGICLGALVIAAGGCIRSVGDIPVEEGGFIRGAVVARSAETGLFEPVVGARVELVGSSVGRTTGEDGRFELRRLPLASHRVEISLRAAGNVPPRALRTPAVRLEVPGQDIDLGELRLGGLADLSGSVVLEDDPTPAAAVGTLVVLAATPFAAVVGRDGRFTFRSVPPGPYDIVAYREGYGVRSVDGVLLQAGIAAAAPEIVLGRETPPQAVEVKGRVDVVGGADDNVMATFIGETTTASAPPSLVTSATTDDKGAFTVRVPVGVYRVRFTRPDIRPSELQNVVVTVNGAVGLDPVYLGLAEPNDMDADGIADAEDPDPDGDACEDDAFPNDPLRCFNTDANGPNPDDLADSEDPDDDNDGLLDFEETSAGVDGWITDPFLVSTDGDAFSDFEDNCPLMFSAPMQFPDLNGNGIGDACEAEVIETPMEVDPPTITSFGPNPATVGESVEVIGTNFSPTAETWVSFGGGLASALSVTETLVTAVVPPEARSGALRVISGTRVATASAAFSLVPPPVIRFFEPAAVRPGQQVAVFGLRFADLSGGVAPMATLSRNATNPVVCNAEAESDAATFGLEVMCFAPPPGSVGGAIRVQTPHGEATSGGNLIILEGPSISGFTINPVEPGGTTTILGDGFSLDGVTGELRVDLVGAPDLVPGPFTNGTIQIDVPMNAMTGVVTVRHPSGTVTSAVPLQVMNGVPAVVDYAPPVVMRGETLTIIGAAMDEVESVTFTGGASATYTSRTSGTVTVTVPMGAQAGPVTLVTPSMSSVSTRRLALMTLTSNEPSPGTNMVAGLAVSAQDEIMLWSASSGTPPNKVMIVDSTTLQLVGGAMPDVAVGSASHIASGRGGARTVVRTSNPSALVTVEVPSGAPLPTTCPLVGFSGFYPVTGPNNRYVFAVPDVAGATNGVLRVDLMTGACEYLGTGVQENVDGVGRYGSNLLLSANTGALAVMHPVTGDLIQGFGTLNPDSVRAFGSLFAYTGSPDRVFGYTTYNADQVSVVSLNSGPAREFGGPTTTSYGELSRNTRWLFRGRTLMDLSEERVVRDDLPHAGTGGVATTSDPATFIVRESGVAFAILHRIAIEE